LSLPSKVNSPQSPFAGRKRKIVSLLGLGVFLLALGVYLRTLTPKLGWIDSGEFSVVGAVFGVAHPTGYPLWTLLARLFVLVPLGEVCQRVSFVSAFFAALGAMTAFLIVVQKAPASSMSTNRLLGGVAAGLLLAFSSTYWSQAVDQEVYSLTAFLLALLIYSVSCWARHPSLRGLAGLAYLGGVAMANHLTIMWSGIAALLFVLGTCRKAVIAKAFWVYLFLFAVGVSLYAVLVIRAGCSPILSWGDVRTLPHLYRHLTAWQYRVWMFTGDSTLRAANFKKFLGLWVSQVTPWAFGLGLVGIVRLAWRDRPWLVFLGLIFVIAVGFALNYSIPDIDSYFIPAFLVWALLCGEGVAWIAEAWGKLPRIPGSVRLVRFALPLLVLFPLLGNWRENDLSRNYLPYDFGQNTLRSAEPNALVLTNTWDMYSPVLYIKYVEGARTDVAFVDKELLRRSWYFKYLREQYPWLIQGARNEVESYLPLLDEFEAGTLKDNQEIQRRYLAMINRFIEQSLAERPVYLTFTRATDPTDFPSLAPGLVKVPCGLLYRLLPRDSVVASSPAFELRGVFDDRVYKDERTQVNLLSYPRMGYERGLFLATHQRYAEAAALFRGLLAWPLNPVLVLRALGGCELESGNLDEAQRIYEELLKQDPLDPVGKRGLLEVEKRRKGAP